MAIMSVLAAVPSRANWAAGDKAVRVVARAMSGAVVDLADVEAELNE